MNNSVTKPSEALHDKKEKIANKTIDKSKKEQKSSMEIDNMKNLITLTEDFNEAVVKSLRPKSENKSALRESNKVAVRSLLNIHSEMLESCNRNLLDFTKFSKEALAVRTMQDMTELKNKSLRLVYNNYLDTTNKLYNMLFNSYNETMAPINARTTIVSDKIRKKLAA